MCVLRVVGLFRRSPKSYRVGSGVATRDIDKFEPVLLTVQKALLNGPASSPIAGVLVLQLPHAQLLAAPAANNPPPYSVGQVLAFRYNVRGRYSRSAHKAIAGECRPMHPRVHAALAILRGLLSTLSQKGVLSNQEVDALLAGCAEELRATTLATDVQAARIVEGLLGGSSRPPA